MLGDTTPSLLAGEELEILKSQADIEGLLYNYRNKGFEIELLEPESIGNILTDVLSLSKPDGLQIKYYIDTETGVILKETTVVKIAGIERTYESFYRDYRYANKILFPFSVNGNLEGELIMEIYYNSIDLNAEIKGYRFATPQNLMRELDSNNKESK
jgi:hypothetical protein